MYELQRQAWSLWERIKTFVKFEVKHVYAHGNILPNELADQLADSGREGTLRNGDVTHAENYGSFDSILALHQLPQDLECNPRVWFRSGF